MQVKKVIVYCQSEASKLQQTLLQSGFHYMHENKREQLFAERGKFPYTRSAKHIVVAYVK
jgi:hypothetical protein